MIPLENSVLFDEAVNNHLVLGEMVMMGDSRGTWTQTCPSDSCFQTNKKLLTRRFLRL
jgi:hypothetical protein